MTRSIARRTAALRWAGVAVGAVVGVLAGELTVRPPRGPTRTAAVEVRRIRDYLPRRLGGVVGVAGGVLLILLAATTAAGDPDDMGRPGRALIRRCAAGLYESRTPWPGSFYTSGLAVVVLVGLLMAYLALRAIVRRPRSGNAGDAADDDVLRRRAAHVVTGAVGILVAIPLAGVSLTAANGLLGTSCAPTWWTVTGWVLLALAPAALAMGAWCAAAVLLLTDRADPPVRTR